MVLGPGAFKFYEELKDERKKADGMGLRGSGQD